MLIKDLPLKGWLLRGILEAWYTDTTTVQQKVIPSILHSKNVVCQSQTWTWKTASFLWPLLNKLDSNEVSVQLIILVPTRELSVQIYDDIYKITNFYRMPTVSLYWWVSEVNQITKLKKTPRIIVSTPWRLWDLYAQWYIDFAKVKYFVLDEVDRMLDMGFLPTIKKIWDKLIWVQQTMCFSATLNDQITNTIKSYVKEFELIKMWWEISPAKIEQKYILVEQKDKLENLVRLIALNKREKILIFVNKIDDTKYINNYLIKEWYLSWFINWDVHQSKRLSTLKSYTDWWINILVTTDVASRWLNMERIWLVINYDLPKEIDSYVHRIGRTARAGAYGKSLALVTKNEKSFLDKFESKYWLKIKQLDYKVVLTKLSDEQIKPRFQQSYQTKDRNKSKTYSKKPRFK